MGRIGLWWEGELEALSASHRRGRGRNTGRSVTAGDAVGLLVDVDGPGVGNDKLRERGVLQHRAAFGEIAGARSPLPARASTSAWCGRWSQAAAAGMSRRPSATARHRRARTAYWLRIPQMDGAKAWLSPRYVTVEQG